MSRRSPFKQADLARALRAARDAGLSVAGYEIDPATGRIAIQTGAGVAPGKTNEWDEVLR